ncbi:MAG: efflux RND transporter periplasmic adaptor subunit [Myxococcales bacterium]|nr:efflux RND transporter periplasmic adaptor subunit [Myxococcales bacterium]
MTSAKQTPSRLRLRRRLRLWLRARRVAGRSVAVALALCAGLAAGCGKKGQASGGPAGPPPPKEIEILALQPTEVRDTGEYLGSLLSRGSVTVLPQVAGYVRAVLVRPGQKVAAGAPLLEVDAREEAAALASAEAQRAAAAASLGLARQVRERTEALFREGLATAEELDQRRAAVEAADASTRAAEAQVSQRKVAVQYNTVRAAVAGVVGDVLVRVGDFVTASTRATTISQAGALELSISVPAARARSVTVGMPVELVAADGSAELTTQVFFVAQDADPRTQLVELKAAVPEGRGLRSSELVRARVIYSTRQALQVPARAVVRQSGQAFVYVVVSKGQGLVVERRPVTLGDLGASAFVLEQGLGAGDRIAVSAIQQLRDGAAVKLKEPKPAGAPPSGAAGAATGSAGASGAAGASAGSASGPATGGGAAGGQGAGR